jgi:A/G-specific adenine glycosylase
VAHVRGLTASLPAKKPRAAVPQRSTVMLLLRHAGEILLEKRPARGIWGGLWSLPEVAHAREARSVCAKHYGVNVLTAKVLPGIAHGFTHFKLQIDPLLLDVTKSKRRRRGGVGATTPGAEARAVLWLPVADAASAAIPAPVRRIILSI